MKAQNLRGDKNNKNNKWKNKIPKQPNKQQGETIPLCSHFNKINHPQARCWWRQDLKCIKCSDIQHVERICKSKPQEEKVTAEEQQDE